MKYRIVTLGCKVNQQESEGIAAGFRALGFEEAGRGERADVCVINSCTVTAAADSKTRQRIRQARAANPAALVCVVGCWPEVEREGALAMPEVDIVLGSADKGRTAEAAYAALMERGGALDAEQGRSNAEMRKMNANRSRAFIKVQDGCDRFCAYCIVPYARGEIRSKAAAEVMAEAEGVLGAGYRELVLTGINLGLYGADGHDSLHALVERVCTLGGGGHRVRLGSLEPTVVDADEAVRIAGLRGVCPHFHLSLQSGCGRTLEAMGRPYTPEDYAGIVRALRGLDLLFSITTDVIVGFPGETDADFEESLGFVREMGFAGVHVFKYSKRPGTRAAGMDGQVPEAVKNERSKRMMEAAEDGAAQFLRQNAGQRREVLVFGPDKGGRHMRGITDNGIDVRLPADGGHKANEFTAIALESGFWR
ncbi:MAG: tRNA (N(6)-L-threonylcarbamoyladenosine(37)-C(2))-methylthiotransferase MtaB [Clostridiales bacterium]|nr:tRNA (N(6)-L-threonylcarbamoyladenosine(37)-C(2))-methylthiotransferase MtaB [Clostridiales bacterium]